MGLQREISGELVFLYLPENVPCQTRVDRARVLMRGASLGVACGRSRVDNPSTIAESWRRIYLTKEDDKKKIKRLTAQRFQI